MFGLREKLLCGFGSLLALLLVTGGLAVLLLDQYSGTVNRVFRDNYRSVVYGQSMKDAVDEIIDQHHTQGASADQVQSRNAIRTFTENLDLESHNITVPGEVDAVSALEGRWKAFLARLAADPPAQPAPDTSVQSLRLQGALVKQAAQRIITLNLDNILDEDGQIRRSSVFATRSMYALLGAGILVAVASTAVSLRSILGPIRVVTQSAREIERGNLDLMVPVGSQDEIGALASAFNSMAATLRDVRRLDHHAILRAQHTTQLALDSLPDAVAIIAPDGMVDLSNHTAQTLFQLRPGSSITHPQILALYRTVLEHSQPIHPKGYDSALHVTGEQERFFLPHALPILERDGQMVGVTVILVDITNLRRLDEMKSNLLAVVSHELRTPLTGMRMATHLLLDEKTGPLTPKQVELALAARDEANRMHVILEGLLDISRIESGKEMMECQSLTPAALARAAMEPLQGSFRDRGIHVDLIIPADLPLVLADPIRIQHVFANLLGNALTYTPAGGSVSLRARTSEDGVEFQIENSGPSIPEAHRVRIFERFYRVPGQGGRGAGLGLAIAKEIVIAHGGRIWLEDAGGTGCRFCFTMRRARGLQSQARPDTPLA